MWRWFSSLIFFQIMRLTKSLKKIKKKLVKPFLPKRYTIKEFPKGRSDKLTLWQSTQNFQQCSSDIKMMWVFLLFSRVSHKDGQYLGQHHTNTHTTHHPHRQPAKCYVSTSRDTSPTDHLLKLWPRNSPDSLCQGKHHCYLRKFAAPLWREF